MPGKELNMELVKWLAKIDYRLPGLLLLNAAGLLAKNGCGDSVDKVKIPRTTLQRLLTILEEEWLIGPLVVHTWAAGGPLVMTPKHTYIKENGHLPNTSLGREWAGSGLEVGPQQTDVSLSRPETLGALRGGAGARASNLYNSAYYESLHSAEGENFILTPPSYPEERESEREDETYHSKLGVEAGKAPPPESPPAWLEPSPLDGPVPDLSEFNEWLSSPAEATPPTAPSVKPPRRRSAAPKRVKGPVVAGTPSDATESQPGPFMGIYTHLLEITAFRYKWDPAAWDKRMAEYMVRYDVTVDELEKVAFELKNWASDLRGRTIKSPAGTYATFVQNHVKFRNAAAARGGGGNVDYAKTNPRLNEKWQQDYRRSNPLDGIMD